MNDINYIRKYANEPEGDFSMTRFWVSPSDIAKALRYLVVNIEDDSEKECAEALQILEKLAGDPNNKDCIRTLYTTLSLIADNVLDSMPDED